MQLQSCPTFKRKENKILRLCYNFAITLQHLPVAVVVVEFVHDIAEGGVGVTDQMGALFVAVEVADHFGAGHLGDHAPLAVVDESSTRIQVKDNV